MKVVLYTQIRENYGAHDWDGQGECPQYWKMKGGNTYVVHGVSVENAQDSAWWDSLHASIESFDESFEEYILGSDLVDECDYDASKVCEEWDSPIELTLREDGEFVATRYTKAELCWSDNDVVAKMERWVQTAGQREDYLLMYEMKDGDLLTYKEWCAQREVA